jgi:CRP/FNR family transcriptional regulator, cyclic AMP receptor protein
MSLVQEVEALRRVPIFRQIEPRRLKLLAFASERLTYPAGQDIVVQGDAGDAAYIILKGEAEVLVVNAGSSLRVARLGEHEVIGEIALLTGVPRTATVRAATEVVALRIGKETFFKLIAEVPDLGLEIMKELARRLERTTAELHRAKAEAA